MNPAEASYPAERHYTVRVRPAAFQDLEHIRDYIASDHPDNALAYVGRLVDAIAALSFMPGSWPRVPTRHIRDLRQRLIGSHRILFQVVEEPPIVVVSRVVHAQRSLPPIIRSLKTES